jgi:hypothetical protein
MAVYEDDQSDWDQDKSRYRGSKGREQYKSALVGIQNADGQVYVIRVKYNGRPETLGNTLEQHWTNPRDVRRLLRKGEAAEIKDSLETSSFMGGGVNTIPLRKMTMDRVEDYARHVDVSWAYVLTKSGWKTITVDYPVQAEPKAPAKPGVLDRLKTLAGIQK